MRNEALSPADVCETDQLTQADIKVNVPQLHLVMSEETLKKVMDILLSFDGGSGVPKQIEDAGKVDKVPCKEGSQHEKNPVNKDKTNSLHVDHLVKKNGEENAIDILDEDDVTTNNTSYFKYHFQISLSAFDFDWKEATITNGAKQPTFSRVFGMSLENFDVLAEMDNIKQHIQVGLRNISMTQYSFITRMAKNAG